MLQEKKKFTGSGSGGDFDSAPTEVLPFGWVNAENVRTLTTDAGEVGNLESLGSNVLKNNPYLFTAPPNQPQPDNIYNGAATDEPNNRFVEFIWDTFGEGGLFAYDLNAQTWYKVITEDQVTNGFTWDLNKFIHSARIINGNIYWVDGLNVPRRLDIDAGIKMNHPSYVTPVTPYTTPLSQSVISIVRRQPGLPPSQTKITQTSPVVPANQVALGAWTFAYRYIYRGYEISALSGQSTLANYNAEGDTFNRIDIVIPTYEKIDQDVIQVDIVARFLDTEIYFVIHSWKKKIPADAAAIVAHNNTVMPVPLTYSFYNDVSGIALDSAYSVKIFDSVPINATSIEMAKNRAFLSNYILGYDTPLTTSLALTLISKVFPTGGGGPLTGEWFLIKYNNPLFHTAYVLKTTTAVGADPPGPAYYYTWNTIVPPFPATVNAADLTFRGNTYLQAATSISGIYTFLGSEVDQGVGSVINSASPPLSAVVGTVFKSDAALRISISFKDNSGLECGILTNQNLVVQIPDTGFSTQTYIIGIAWILSNVNALLEIPDWAYYYSINVTKCLKTRFFVESLADIIYAAKDTSGNYTFTTTAYSNDLAGVAIDLTFLNSHSQGYSFTIGDVAKLYVNGNPFTLAIIDQVAQYAICELKDVGALSAKTGLFEIYTPYKTQTNEPYFEIGQIYPIVNPGQSTRTYSTLNGTIGGDVALFGRINAGQKYVVEAMNPNDKFYLNWFTNSGRPNFVDDIGQVKKTSSIAYSNTFIPGSQNNGLSTFEALNTKDVYPECGAILKLQLTSKVEGEAGNVMLAICTKETASLYIGETQVVSAVSNAFLAQATGVIGTINVLKGGFGTLHPESVTEFRGNVYFLSATNGKFVQYSANGLFPISNYKAARFWKLFCEQLLSMTQAQIIALGSRPFVFTCVDSNNWELLVSIPKLLLIPPKGYLPDYPAKIYPFDIWDGQAKTMVYKLSAEPNHWSGAYTFSPEGLLAIQNKVFSFNKAQAYQHNSSIFPLTYYGVAQKARIMILANIENNRPKVYNNISVEGNYRPSFIYFRTEPSLVDFEQYDLIEQASDLIASDFEIKEGQMYSFIFRNKIVTTGSGVVFTGLLTAEKMRALVLKTLIEFTPTSQPLELRAVNFGFQISAGHTT